MSDFDAMDGLFAAARHELNPPPDAERRVLVGVVGAAGAVGVTTAATSQAGRVAMAKNVVASLLFGTLTATAVVVGAVKPFLAAPATLLVPLLAPGLVVAQAGLTREEPSPPAPNAQPEPAAEVLDLDEPGGVEVHVPHRTSAAPDTVASKPADDLRAELALMRRAQAALRGGDPSGALSLVEAHRRRFVRGTLAPERIAVRIRALCALGRIDAARASFDQLSGGAPRSPHLASLAASCPGLIP
ncbi:MAG: hypothetical protein AAGN82_24965 [Myxococcota bacterium]